MSTPREEVFEMKRLFLLVLIAALLLGAVGPAVTVVQTDSGATADVVPHGPTPPPDPPPEGGGDYGFNLPDVDILA